MVASRGGWNGSDSVVLSEIQEYLAHEKRLELSFAIVAVVWFHLSTGKPAIVPHFEPVI